MIFEKIDREAYTQDQRIMADFVSKLSDRYGRKYWLAKAEAEEFPWEMWNEIADNGYFGLIIPEAYGGTGFSFSDLRVFLEELAKAGLFTLHFVSFFMDSIMLMHGNEDLRQRYLTKMARGTYFSFALTEPDAGTNSLRIRTTAEKDGEFYRINGQKLFISGADESEFMVLVARTMPFQDNNKKERKSGISLFVVDSHAPGITMQAQDVAIVSPDRQYTVFFDDVKVPAKDMIGEENRGFSYLLSGLNLERVIISCFSLGMGKFVLERAIAYARERNIFGAPIGSYQGIQHPLSRAFIELQLASLANQKASQALDGGENPSVAGMYANMAKLSSSEAAFHACDAALQTLGGYGFTKEYDIINFSNAIRALRVAPVNNEMILNYVGEHFLDLPRSY
ncbi:MAG: acyl-CoA dehydrogenase family protein [Desulfatiglans sp.]|jgi:acyl-CoA dehydrogenase|nr:acyl-CoA dehydrogenase family protein [Thermodesulfobacteriota bacterium]MEE4354437.1 acyl-CoA dehydrogenase family protein [Desulfatiglans sp.]